MAVDRALYIGPSHAAGGIPVVVDGVKPVEVEGMEYKICGDAYRSPEKLDFKGKTNLEVLDLIHNDFSCNFDQGKAAGTDFIICKLAVRDLTKHDRYGTVREILDQMQGEVGCKLSDGSLPEPKMKQGGVLLGGFYNKRPYHGYVKWKNWAQFEKEYSGITGTLKGKIDITRGSAFDICDDFQDIEEVIMGKADLFDLSHISIVGRNDIRRVINQAVTLPGNSFDELTALKELYEAAEPQITYDILKAIPSITEAAKMLGYGGILIYEDKLYPTVLFVWDINEVRPIIINDAHNKLFFDKTQPKYATGGELEGKEEKKDDDNYVREQISTLKGSLDFLEGEDATEVKKHIAILEKQLKGERGGSAYAARVAENLRQMGTEALEWKAVPVIGTHSLEIKGKTKEMPVFEFPQGYATAPSLYKNISNGTPTCELCGKTPIVTFYWIQNDPKKWTLGVGSECIKHFQQESGKEMQRAAKVEQAKEFDMMLKKICLWIKAFGFKGAKENSLSSPKRLRRDLSKWKYLFQNQSDRFVKNGSERFFMWQIYNDLFPFQYEELLNYELARPVTRFDQEKQKWVPSGQADPDTARLEAEKQLLSWYTRKKDKYLATIKKIDSIFKDQKALCEKEYPGDASLCEWCDKQGQLLSSELEQITGKLDVTIGK